MCEVKKCILNDLRQSRVRKMLYCRLTVKDFIDAFEYQFVYPCLPLCFSKTSGSLTSLECRTIVANRSKTCGRYASGKACGDEVRFSLDV